MVHRIVLRKFARNLSIEIVVFHYFERENGDLSDARNVGIIHSQGEFISFIDSDDWIDPTYVEDLYKAALLNDSEVVVSNYKEFHNEQKRFILIHFFDDY